MSLAATALLTWSSLFGVLQADDADTDTPTETPPAPEPETRREPPGLPPLDDAAVALRIQPAGDPLPHMRWDAPVTCAHLVPTPSVPSGEYRLQCDAEKRVCLVSSTRELDDGVEGIEPLTRVQSCDYASHSIDWAERARQGWQFVPAVAEAPPGWYRDDEGRVMQFNFDLNRRFYLGGAWSPIWLRSGQSALNRYRADFGLEIEFPDDKRETLYRIHILEGEFLLGAESSASVSAFRYEWSHQNDRPVARISTFIGRPARFDLSLNLGGYLEAMVFDTVRRNGVTETQLLLGTAQPTFDLWHSKDLVSYLRVRAGPGVALDTIREQVNFIVQAALELDVTVDQDGFHHARVSAEGEKIFFAPQVPLRVRDPQRLRLKAEYEVIFIAINDQPLSLVLDGRGTWRDDLPGFPAGWEWSAGAGLRFSLWAPARRTAPSGVQQ